MSDEKGFGIDMVPERIPDFAVVDDPKPVPATEVERDESVNADMLRRACHLSVQRLITHVRGLPPGAPIILHNLVRLTAQELETAIARYLAVERTFRDRR